MPSGRFRLRSIKDEPNIGEEQICGIRHPSSLSFKMHPTTNTAEDTLYEPTPHVQLNFSLLQHGQPKTPSSDQFDKVMCLFAHCTSERDTALDSRACFILSCLKTNSRCQQFCRRASTIPASQDAAHTWRHSVGMHTRNDRQKRNEVVRRNKIGTSFEFLRDQWTPEDFKLPVNKRDRKYESLMLGFLRTK